MNDLVATHIIAFLSGLTLGIGVFAAVTIRAALKDIKELELSKLT